MQFISDYKFENGSHQFKVKWKSFPESKSEWKLLEDCPEEELVKFQHEYMEKLLLNSKDSNYGRLISRKDMSLKETFDIISLLGLPPQFTFISNYKIEKNKSSKLLKDVEK